MDVYAIGVAGYCAESGERTVEQEIRENDHKQTKVLLDYYHQTIGSFPPHIAEIAEEWERFEATDPACAMRLG